MGLTVGNERIYDYTDILGMNDNVSGHIRAGKAIVIFMIIIL